MSVDQVGLVEAAEPVTRVRLSRRPTARPESDEFRPVISLRTGRVWAIEAPASNDPDAALGAFAASPPSAELGVALRLDPSRIADPAAFAARLAQRVDGLGIPRGRFVIELVEHDVDDLDQLVEFTRAFRAHGLLVAVVEVGTGHPSAERIVRIEPDILAIDPSVVRGVASAAARREACRAITELARSIGALVIADGLEDAEDLIELAMVGIDLFQGPLVASSSADLVAAIDGAEERATAFRSRLRERAERELVRRREERAVHETVFVAVVTRIAHTRVPELDAVASELVRGIEGLEALYVLDDRGVQLTDTWTQPGLVPRSGFRPASRGSDFGLKEYFLEVSYGGSAYVSRPYVSMASGRLCVTHSRRVRIADGRTVVVCCDVPSGARG